MASQTYVLPWSCSTPALPAPDIAKHLAEANYSSYFTLLDPIAVSEMSDEERSKVQGILLTGGFSQDRVKLDGEIIDLLPNLRVIGTPSTGINHIDVEAATTRAIRVGNSPGYFISDSVADMAFSLLLGSARNIVQGDKVSKSPEITLKQDMIRAVKCGEDVTGATIGIIGLGNIGLAVAERAKGFRMKILYHSRTRKEEKERKLGIIFCPNLEDLLSESDFVVICVPLTSQTKYLISFKELNLMKCTATLINVARGAIINHDDLTAALHNGVIRGVALDVTDPLPLPRDHPLLNMSNVIIVPHLGTLTKRTYMQCWQGAFDNIKAGVQGHPLPYPYN